MSMPEIQRRVAGKEIEVTTTDYVGDPRTFCRGNHHGQRIIIVRTPLLGVNELCGGQRGGRGDCCSSARAFPRYIASSWAPRWVGTAACSIGCPDGRWAASLRTCPSASPSSWCV